MKIGFRMRNVTMFRGFLSVILVATSAILLLSWNGALHIAKSEALSDSSWEDSCLDGKVPMAMELYATPPTPSFRPLLVPLWVFCEFLSVEIPTRIFAVRPGTPRAPPSAFLI